MSQSGNNSFHTFCDFIDWPPRPTASTSNNSVQRGGRSMGMCKTCPDHLNLFTFRICSKYRTLRPDMLVPTSDLITKTPNHVLSMLRRQQCSSIRIFRIPSCTNHVSEPHSRIDLTAPVYIQRVIRDRMSHRSHRCLKLVNASRVLCVRKDIFLIYK